ncbi:uncharacterized protein ACWYII_017161 [Salvelinus alpinus]
MLNTSYAASWSDPRYTSSSDEEEEGCRYRTTHQTLTKQRSNGQQRQQQQRPITQDSWTWEEILEGKGHWAKIGEYRRSREELEAAKAEDRWYEEAARKRGWKPEKKPQKFLGGAKG